MQPTLTTRTLLSLTALFTLATAGPAVAQGQDVLSGTYTYGWIGADLGYACGAPAPEVLARIQLGTLDFDPGGTVAVTVDQRTVCPGGGVEELTLASNGTYTLGADGRLALSLDSAALGTASTEFLTTWNRNLGTSLLDEEFHSGLPGMGVLVRNASGLGSDDLLGDYAVVRVRQSQVSGGIEARGAFGTLSLEPGGTYTLVLDWLTIGPSGATSIIDVTTTGTYLLQPDGTLLLDGGVHQGAVTPDGDFGLLVRKAPFGTLLTLLVREPESEPTSWALDDFWGLAFYGVIVEEHPVVEVTPNAETGLLAFDAQTGRALVGHTAAWVDSTGGGSRDGFSPVTFRNQGLGAYLIEAEPGVGISFQLGRSEDVSLFARLDGPDELLVGVAPRTWGPLAGDRRELSLTAGGAQTLSIRTGAAHDAELYLVLGSLSGTYPGFTQGGTLVPLNYDAYTQLTLALPNQPPLSSSFGLLDGQGAALSAFGLPAGASPTLVGLTLDHAVLVIDLTAPQPVVLASNPVRVSLTN